MSETTGETGAVDVQSIIEKHLDDLQGHTLESFAKVIVADVADPLRKEIANFNQRIIQQQKSYEAEIERQHTMVMMGIKRVGELETERDELKERVKGLEAQPVNPAVDAIVSEMRKLQGPQAWTFTKDWADRLEALPVATMPPQFKIEYDMSECVFWEPGEDRPEGLYMMITPLKENTKIDLVKSMDDGSFLSISKGKSINQPSKKLGQVLFGRLPLDQSQIMPVATMPPRPSDEEIVVEFQKQFRNVHCERYPEGGVKGEILTKLKAEDLGCYSCIATFAALWATEKGEKE